LQNVINEMTAKQARLEEELRQANERLQSSHMDRAFLAMLHKVQAYDDWLRTGRQLAIPAVCLLLLVVAISTVIAGLMRKVSRAIPLYLASAACGVAACLVFINHAESQRQDGERRADRSIAETRLNENRQMEPEDVARKGDDPGNMFGLGVNALDDNGAE